MPLSLEISHSFLICCFCCFFFRKFAAQLANKQQQQLVVPEVDTKPMQSAPIRNDSELHHPIAEEDDAMGESAVPMFVQHTEAMLDEIDRMVIIKQTHLSLPTIVLNSFL